MYKFDTRDYSPTLGRWTQKNPVGGSVGKVGSGNVYVYANNAPVMLTDPSGKDATSCAYNLALSGGGEIVSVLGLAGSAGSLATAEAGSIAAGLASVGLVASILGLILARVAILGTLYFSCGITRD